MDDAQLQVLTDRLTADALVGQLRPNGLTRYGETRSGALAAAAVLAGTALATGGVVRRIWRYTDPLAAERLYAKTLGVDRDRAHADAERLYAKTLGVDRDRAHADVHYVDQRLRLLAATDDPEPLIRGAARALVPFVAAGRPAEQRLDDVERAYMPLREATDDNRPAGTLTGLHAAYVDAWRRALS